MKSYFICNSKVSSRLFQFAAYDLKGEFTWSLYTFAASELFWVDLKYAMVNILDLECLMNNAFYMPKFSMLDSTEALLFVPPLSGREQRLMWRLSSLDHKKKQGNSLWNLEYYVLLACWLNAILVWIELERFLLFYILNNCGYSFFLCLWVSNSVFLCFIIGFYFTYFMSLCGNIFVEM